MIKNLKVGKWFLKLTPFQQQEFARLYYRNELFDKQSARKFFTATYRDFGDNVTYIKNGVIKKDGITFFYSHDNDIWYKK